MLATYEGFDMSPSATGFFLAKEAVRLQADAAYIRSIGERIERVKVCSEDSQDWPEGVDCYEEHRPHVMTHPEWADAPYREHRPSFEAMLDSDELYPTHLGLDVNQYFWHPDSGEFIVTFGPISDLDRDNSRRFSLGDKVFFQVLKSGPEGFDCWIECWNQGHTHSLAPAAAQ